VCSTVCLMAHWSQAFAIVRPPSAVLDGGGGTSSDGTVLTGVGAAMGTAVGILPGDVELFAGSLDGLAA